MIDRELQVGDMVRWCFEPTDALPIHWALLMRKSSLHPSGGWILFGTRGPHILFWDWPDAFIREQMQLIAKGEDMIDG